MPSRLSAYHPQLFSLRPSVFSHGAAAHPLLSRVPGADVETGNPFHYPAHTVIARVISPARYICAEAAALKHDPPALRELDDNELETLIGNAAHASSLVSCESVFGSAVVISFPPYLSPLARGCRTDL